jgi:hypothetical protein
MFVGGKLFLLWVFALFTFYFSWYFCKILMSVLVTHVNMDRHVTTWWITTHVHVLLDMTDTTVKMVRTFINMNVGGEIRWLSLIKKLLTKFSDGNVLLIIVVEDWTLHQTAKHDHHIVDFSFFQIICGMFVFISFEVRVTWLHMYMYSWIWRIQLSTWYVHSFDLIHIFINYYFKCFFFVFCLWNDSLMVLNATFNNISAIPCQSVLLVEEIGVPGEKHWPVICHWQTLSHYVVSSTPRHERGSNSAYSAMFEILVTWIIFQYKTLKTFLLQTAKNIGNNRKHWPVICHWQTLSHYVVSSTPRHERGSNSPL